MANSKHVALLKKGAGAWNKWREKQWFEKMKRKKNFWEVDRCGPNLAEADLRRVDLTRMDLSGTNLRNALLTGANLTGANLSAAYISNALLAGANLNGG